MSRSAQKGTLTYEAAEPRGPTASSAVVSAGTMSSCPVAVEEAKTNMALSSTSTMLKPARTRKKRIIKKVDAMTCGDKAPW